MAEPRRLHRYCKTTGLVCDLSLVHVVGPDQVWSGGNTGNQFCRNAVHPGLPDPRAGAAGERHFDGRNWADLTPSDWLRLSVLGVVFYSVTQGAQFVALGFLPAVTLSLILCFSPAVVALLGASFLGERLTRRPVARSLHLPARCDRVLHPSRAAPPGHRFGCCRGWVCSPTRGLRCSGDP